MDFWLRIHGVGNIGMVFRCDAPVGTCPYLYSGMNDGYYIYFARSDSNSRIRRAKDGSYTNISQAPVGISQNTWTHMRVVWWESWGVLHINIYRWTGTEWLLEAGLSCTDTENVNSEGPVQRCGFGCGDDDNLDDWKVEVPA